jgi:hypothetical protein
LNHLALAIKSKSAFGALWDKNGMVNPTISAAIGDMQFST